MEQHTHSKAQIIIEDPELLWKGHFALASGRHSGIYWEKFRLLERPDLLAVLCEPIADKFRDVGVDVVIGPTLGGVLVAYEVARQMGKKAVFVERAPNHATRVFRPPTILHQGHRILIVDDVLMTGWTLHRTIDAVQAIGAEICGIGIILDRSMTTSPLMHPLFAVHRMQIPDYDPANCPLCSQGIPLTAAAGKT